MIFRGAIYEVKPAKTASGHEQWAKSRILTDQIYSVDHSRLGEFKGMLDPDESEALDRALLLKHGLL